MTVVILYLTSPLEQLVRIYLGSLQIISTYLYSTSEGGGEYLFFVCMMVGSIDSFNFTSHTYFVLFFLLLSQ